MMIVIHWDDGSMDKYESLEEAKDGVLSAHAEGIFPVTIEDIHSEKQYGCSWFVELEEL